MNIYLIEWAPSLFPEYSFFLELLMQKSSCFSLSAQKFQQKTSLNKQKSPNRVSLINPWRWGWGIMFGSVTEICMWNLSLRDESRTSAGFGNYSDKAFETLLSAEWEAEDTQMLTTDLWSNASPYRRLAFHFLVWSYVCLNVSQPLFFPTSEAAQSIWLAVVEEALPSGSPDNQTGVRSDSLFISVPFSILLLFSLY